jgi:hypothetical protein
MADLSQKTTDRRLAFTKYVTDNKRFKEIDFQIETNKSTPIYVIKGAKLVAVNKLPAGTKFKITDSKLHELSGMKMAAVKHGTTAGFIPINMIRKPTGGNGTQYEDQVVDAINSYILKAGGKIDIKLKGDTKIYKDISYALKVDASIKRAGGVRGDPKADIILVKDKTNPLGPGGIYVSHKKEGGPEAFQQYGGISEQAGSKIYNNEKVQEFLGIVANALNSGKLNVLPHPIMANFNDIKLANMAIYGPEYGSSFSLQHTQIIGQGKPAFKMVQSMTDFSELDFPDHMSLSGDLSHFVAGYLPVFGATFRAGRGFSYNGKRFEGARVAIYPQKLMATRTGLVEHTI